MAEQNSGGTGVVALTVTALWLGAALFTAAVVAPAAFSVLPSRSVAGALIGRVLPALFVAGLVSGTVVAILEVVGTRGKQWFLRVLGALSVAAACGIAQFMVAPRIARVREAAGGAIDSLPGDHALRAEFGKLHGISVAWLGVAILAACSIVFLSWLGLRSTPSEPEK